MDFKSTVFRSSPEAGGGIPKYDVPCKRIPFNTKEGREAVDPLLVREKAARKQHYLDRGYHEAKATQEQQSGISGLWSVVDFTGRYHRPLIDTEPSHTIPGHALVREDTRPGESDRVLQLDMKFDSIAKKHEESMKAQYNNEKLKIRLQNQSSGVEKSFVANDAMIEKRVMMAEAANMKNELEKSLRDSAVRDMGHRKSLRGAVTDEEVELLASSKHGREATIKIFMKIKKIDPVFVDPNTRRSALHLAWDFWEPLFGVKGAVDAIIKEDPRYNKHEKLRRSHLPEDGVICAPTAPSSIEAVKEHHSVEAGPRAQRAKRCMDACLATEMIVSLLLEAAVRINTLKGTPWVVRDFTNCQDILGRSALHIAAERGHVMLLHDLVLAGGDLRLLNNKGETPISIAVSRGQLGVVEYLANSKFTGANLAFRLGLDIHDDVGRYPIHRIYEYWREVEVTVDAWGAPMSGAGTGGLDRGSDPKEGPRHGHAGITRSDLRHKPQPLTSLKQLPESVIQEQITRSCMILIMLLRAGCDVNVRTRDGRNALHEATRRRLSANVRTLLAFGGDHEAKDENGVDPLEIWRLQAGMELNDAEKERRSEVGKLLKSWSIIKKEHKNSEFVVLWRAWLKTKEVSGVKFVEMEDALRALSIDELVVIKAQADRKGMVAIDEGWAAWAEKELKRNGGAAPTPTVNLDIEEDEDELNEKEEEELKKLENGEGGGGGGGGSALKKFGKGGRSEAKRRWNKMKMMGVKTASVLKQVNQQVHVDPMERGRRELMEYSFGAVPLAQPEDKPIPFRLDEYIFSMPNKDGKPKKVLFQEPHKPDPYRDIPLLEKGMVFSDPPQHAFKRPNDLERYRKRRTGYLAATMQDAVQPDTLRTAATTSVLGGTRLVTFDPRAPPVSRPAMLALKDMEDHELKVAGIKKFVKLMGETAEEVVSDKTEPFVRRPPVDLNGPPPGSRPLEHRVIRPNQRRQFSEGSTLPKFPAADKLTKVALLGSATPKKSK